MPRYDQPFNFLGQQNALNTMLASTWFNSGTEALLDAQADFLTGLRGNMAEWIDRRHAAIQETKQLVARLQQGHELDDFVQAYQSWIERALERVAADVAGFYSAMTLIGQIGRESATRQSQPAETAANVAAPRFAQARAGGRPARG